MITGHSCVIYCDPSFQQETRLRSYVIKQVNVHVQLCDLMLTIATSQHFCMQGSDASWKGLEFLVKFPGPEKSWKMILVLESFHGIFWDMDTMMRMQNYSHPHTSSHVTCIRVLLFVFIFNRAAD